MEGAQIHTCVHKIITPPGMIPKVELVDSRSISQPQPRLPSSRCEQALQLLWRHSMSEAPRSSARETPCFQCAPRQQAAPVPLL